VERAGPAIVGNFGGSRFFEYTAYGDTINVAARLESANSSSARRSVPAAMLRQRRRLRLRDRGSAREARRGERRSGEQHPAAAEGSVPIIHFASSLRRGLLTHGFVLSLTMQRKPTWLVEVSTGWAWRAAGR